MALTSEEQKELDSLIRKRGGKIPSYIQNRSMGKSITQSIPFQAIFGVGDALSNMMSATYSTISGSEYEPIKMGEGLTYELFGLATQIAPFLAPGPHQATLGARALTGIGTGFLFNPDDPVEGALDAAFWTGIGESLPIAGKYIMASSDIINMPKFVEGMTDNIKRAYSGSQKQAWGIIEPYFEKMKGAQFEVEWMNKITKPLKDLNYTSIDIEDKINLFEHKPTVENLQKIKTAIGRERRALDPADSANLETIKEFTKAERYTKGKIIEALEIKSPDAKEAYNKFDMAYATGPGQYEFDRTMNSILTSENAGMTPKALEETLTKGANRTKKGSPTPILPATHELRTALGITEEAIAQSELYKKGAQAGTATIGAAAGASLFGIPGLAGAGLGYVAPQALSWLTDPKIVSQIEKWYPSTRQTITGMVVQPNDEIKVRSQFGNEEAEITSQRGEALR